LFSRYGQVSFFLVESDSSDITIEVLKRSSTRDSRVSFTSLGDLRLEVPERISRIAMCRNVYLEHIRNLFKNGGGPDFVVVADFDGVNSKVKYDPRYGEIFRPKTVVTANQVGRYYDVLALRSKGWVSEDYRLSILKDGEVAQDPLLLYQKHVSRKQRRIYKAEAEFPVESAFGGLAIYPGEMLTSCKYFAPELAPGVFECEHVSLNECLSRAGAQIVIAPYLRNRGEAIHVAKAGVFADLYIRLIVLTKKLLKIGSKSSSP